jgi:hypothetical protein
MELLNNAVQSIQIGVEDFRTGQPDRALSAVRNIYAGILLLYKEKLRLLSPEDTNESLVKDKILLIQLPDGSIKYIGVGKKTANVNQIKERFKNLDIEIEWNRFDNLSSIRNDIEHYYTEKPQDAIREALSESFLPIRDFTSKHLEYEPIEILEQDCWNTLLQNAEIFKKEKEEYSKSLELIKLESKELEGVLHKAKCINCSSSLIKFTNNIADNLEGVEVICKSCGEELNFMEIAEICLGEYYAWESYVAMTDGGDQPLEECPECLRNSYIMEKEECLLCQFLRENTECSICGAELEIMDHQFGGLCWYCHHKLTKDD